MSRARAIGQLTAMFTRDLLGQGQAQATAFGAATDQWQEQVFGQLFGHALAAVSYTHLDVYKRQTVITPHATRAPALPAGWLV